MSQETNIENEAETDSFLQKSIRKTYSDFWFNQTIIDNQNGFVAQT